MHIIQTTRTKKTFCWRYTKYIKESAICITVAVLNIHVCIELNWTTSVLTSQTDLWIIILNWAFYPKLINYCETVFISKLNLRKEVALLGDYSVGVYVFLFTWAGLKKYLNSTLPVGQVTLKFCLPRALSCLPKFSNSLIIHKPKNENIKYRHVLM